MYQKYHGKPLVIKRMGYEIFVRSNLRNENKKLQIQIPSIKRPRINYGGSSTFSGDSGFGDVVGVKIMG